MATPVCRYNKFGYCKFKEHCRKQHVNEVCTNDNCEVHSCSLRHPKSRKYYREYGRCKFNPCAFKHKDSENDFENLKSENITIKEKIEAIDKSLKELQVQEMETVSIIEKQSLVEQKLGILEKEALVKDLKIEEYQ